MAERDPFVLSYSHLRDLPREADALLTLKKLASLVKPIMRARGWCVNQLAEFYPDQQNLLGLNVNRGQKILLRLRYPYDKTLFIPFDEVADTLLHELSHIVFGPHDEKFHALWNQLRDEHEALVSKGYTGEGFLSDGHRLGGGRIPMHEARRLARAAAEQRRVQLAGSGQKLGGIAPRRGENIREVIARAAERRAKALKGCGNENHDAGEIRNIAETATRNGFRTQAEEDKANEAAIAEAYWELVQEDEKKRLGDAYVPPSASLPAGRGGAGVTVSDVSSSMLKRGGSDLARSDTPPPPNKRSDSEKPGGEQWACHLCTLHNLAARLCCDACGTPRRKQPSSVSVPKQTGGRAAATFEVIDLTSSPPPRIQSSASVRIAGSGSGDGVYSHNGRYVPSRHADHWICTICKNRMEREWWTCSNWGKMKESS